MLELCNVSAGYSRSSPILSNVTLTLESGQLTVIIGENGAGKSTLLKTVLGLLPNRSGSVTLDGQELLTMKRTDIARRIAYLSQGKDTPHMTVAELVLHGRFPHLQYPRRYTARDREIAQAAMERMHVAQVANRPLATLSGGMRQSAYLAMALSQDTRYILLDEPTTYLDLPHQLALMRTLCELAHEGRGVVAVMHDLGMALSFADRVCLLQSGTVALCGTPREIAAHPLTKELFGVTPVELPNGTFYCAYPSR